MTTPTASKQSRMATSGEGNSKIVRPSSGLPRPSPMPGSGRATPSRALSKESLSGAGVRSSTTDNWIVGDRCYVNGVKPGKVAFLGETRFAAGEWAGVVLDEPAGKNDGSVQGARYFQCPAKHGIFCKINKLERQPVGDTADTPKSTVEIEGSKRDGNSVPPTHSTPENAIVQPVLPIGSPVLPLEVHSTIADEGIADETALQLSPASSAGAEFRHPSTIDANVPTSGPGTESSLKIGDRVIVSGNKSGVLRYLGVTAFKEGVWAGVELDQPLGKNDGSVEGKRYFACKPRHGLFAPASKVICAGSLAGPVLPSMNASYAGLTNSRSSLIGASASKKLPPAPRQTLTSAMRIQRASQSRTGSQESLNSISSYHSFASSNRRVRLGVAALRVRQHLKEGFTRGSVPFIEHLEQRAAAVAGRAGSVGPNATSSLPSPEYTTLQESLKEKEAHVEQLLRERDIERAEMARNAQMAEQAQQELTGFRAEAQRSLEECYVKLEHLQETLEQSEKERRHLKELYDEEKRKCEDLQFRVEEETILRSDVEAKATELEKTMAEMKTVADHGVATITDSQAALNEKTKQLEELQKQIYDKNAKIEELENGAEEHRKQELELRTALLQMETTMSTTMKEKDEKLETLERDLGLAKLSSQADAENMEALKNALRSAEEQRAMAEDLVRTHLDQMASKENELASIKERLEFLINEKTSTEGHLQQEFHVVQEQLAVAKKHAQETGERLAKELSERDTQISQLAHENTKLKTEIETLSAESTNDKKKIQTLEDQLTNIQKSLATLQAQKDALQADFTHAVQTQNEVAGVALENAKREYQSVDAKLRQTEEEFTKLQTICGQMQVENADLKGQVESIKNSQLLASDEALKHALAEKEKIHTDLSKVRMELSNTEATLMELRKSNADVVAEKQQLEERLSNQIAALQSMLDESTRSAQQEKANLDELMQKTSRELECLKQDSEQLKGTNATLEQTISSMKAQLKEAQSKLEEQQINSKHEKEVIDGQIQKRVQDYEDRMRDLNEKLQLKMREFDDACANNSKLQSDFASLKKEHDSLSTVIQQNANDKDAATREYLERIEDLSSKLQKEIDLRNTSMRQLEEQSQAAIRKVEQEKGDLLEQLSEMEAKSAELAKQLLETEAKSVDMSNKLSETEAKSVEFTKRLLEADGKSMELTKQLSEIGAKNTDMAKRLLEAEAKNMELANKLSEAEAKSAELATLVVKSSADDTTRSPVLAAVDDVDASGHIKFLESIIADQQKTIQELNIKVEVLKHGGVDGLGMSNGLPKVVPPRVYCDICDVFDEHDTDDCPVQASVAEDEETHSHHHGKRGGGDRLYCDTCEMFGHSTDTCTQEDHETY